MTAWTNFISPFAKSFMKCYSLIASTYICSHVTSFLSFSVFLFAAASHLLSAFYCCSFAGFLLKYLVFIILWINNCYTVSCCMNTYHGHRLVNICNINRSWCNYNAGTSWHNLCKTIVYLMYLTNSNLIDRSWKLCFHIYMLSILSITKTKLKLTNKIM